MKDALHNLNKAFENRIRLGIMSLLMVNERVGFKELKKKLDLSDGNLASHLANLEKNAFISVHKSFVGRKPHTEYEATPEGRTAFTSHLNALEAFLKQIDHSSDSSAI